MPQQDPLQNSQPPSDTKPVTEKIVTTEDLFQGQTEIFIEHEGERYRLRITRRNKLILQK